jgi:predicted DNA-binding protein with PD1-like motif
LRWKLVSPDHPVTYAVIFDTDDEVVSMLTRFAADRGLSAAAVTAIGAFRAAKLGYFDWQSKKYKEIPVEEQVEVVSAIGDIALASEMPSLHLHAVLGKSDGSVVGGHLLLGLVRPTLEVIVTEAPVHLKKKKDRETGLNLIDLDA